MPEIKKYAPGEFCWVELGTTDAKKATAFYSEFFGWKTEENPMDQSGEVQGVYTMLRKGKKDIGGMYELFPEMRKSGVPPHWLSYVSVKDVDAIAKKAKSLGATVLMEPMDVMEHGRMVCFQDPTGAAIACWQPKTHHGTEVKNEPSSPCWFELITKDTDKAGKFYKQLFGWELAPQAMGPIQYTMLMTKAGPAGGMMAPTPEMGPVPSHWAVYFSVADCQEDVERAKGLKAQVIAPPSEIPGVGTMAVLQDPQGAYFSIVQLADNPA